MSTHHTLGPLNGPLPTSAEVQDGLRVSPSNPGQVCMGCLGEEATVFIAGHSTCGNPLTASFGPHCLRRLSQFPVIRAAQHAASRKAVLEEVRAKLRNLSRDDVVDYIDTQLAGGDE